MKSWIVSALLLINLNASYAYAEAPATRTLCVYDPSGAHGDAFRVAQDYRDAAMAWGVAFTLKPYTDERTAAEDFKAQQCHAVLLTGTRARPFNPFSSTIEAVGSLPTYAQLGTVIKHLAAPNARQLLQSGPYETLALFPAGAVYLFVRDGGLHALGDLAGRRIATMDYDPAARRLVHEVGASMVTADVGTFAPMFNNGAVDACYAPAVAYAPLELSKGLGKQGGIVRYPLGQLTFQVIGRTQDLPAGFADASRTYAAAQFPRLLDMVQGAEKAIPKDRWIEVPTAARGGYDDLFAQIRLNLRDDPQKIYDRTMLTLLRRVRCKTDANRAECAQARE